MEHIYYGKSVERKVIDESEGYLQRERQVADFELKQGYTADAKYTLKELSSTIQIIKQGENRWFLRYEDEISKMEFIGAYDGNYIPQVGENITILGKSGTILKNEFNAGLNSSMNHYTDIVLDIKDEEIVSREMESARKKFIVNAEDLISYLEKSVKSIEESKKSKLEDESKKWWKFW